MWRWIKEKATCEVKGFGSFVNVIKSLNDIQVQAIKEMRFGSIFYYIVNYIPSMTEADPCAMGRAKALNKFFLTFSL